MSDNKKFTHPRWHTPDFGKTVGHNEVPYEKRVEAKKLLLSLNLITKRQYNEEIEKLKQEYGIK